MSATPLPWPYLPDVGFIDPSKKTADPADLARLGDQLARRTQENLDAISLSLKSANAATPRMVAGTVQANGVIFTGTGFSVSHPATGDYTITFDQPWPSDGYSMMLTPGSTAGSYGVKQYDLSSRTASAFRVLVFATSPFAAYDGNFEFLAVGLVT